MGRGALLLAIEEDPHPSVLTIQGMVFRAGSSPIRRDGVMSKTFARLVGCAGLVACMGGAWGQREDVIVPAPAVPGPVSAPPALPGLPADPGLPVAPALPGLPTAPAPLPFDSNVGGFNQEAAPAGAVPTPPPLTALTTLSAEVPAADGSTTAASATAAPVELFEFLFRDDENIGIVREKYTLQQAEQLKDQEINRIFTQNYTNPNQPAGLPAAPPPGFAGGGQPGQPNPADPRAGAAWDFYYEQLTMYDQYVKAKLLAGAVDLPELSYNADNAQQEAADLLGAYRDAAVMVTNDQVNENGLFYERLQAREDRRRDFYEWLSQQQRDMEEWTGLWARKINGARWADGEPVRRDDWYYGVDFNSAEPVAFRIDQEDYLISRTPQEELAPGQLNVLGSNLTPYDIIDVTGTLKNPAMERLRGTLVQPPTTVLSTDVPAAPATGTVQLVP